jgi:hypothetical protein
MPRRSATPDIPGGVMLFAHPPSMLTTPKTMLDYRSMSTVWAGASGVAGVPVARARRFEAKGELSCLPEAPITSRRWASRHIVSSASRRQIRPDLDGSAAGSLGRPLMTIDKLSHGTTCCLACKAHSGCRFPTGSLGRAVTLWAHLRDLSALLAVERTLSLSQEINDPRPKGYVAVACSLTRGHLGN